MISTVVRSQENNTVSATKLIIETNVAAKRYNNYSKRTIKKTTIRVHYTKEKLSNLTVTSMN